MRPRVSSRSTNDTSVRPVGERGSTEIICLCGYYTCVSMTLNRSNSASLWARCPILREEMNAA